MLEPNALKSSSNRERDNNERDSYLEARKSSENKRALPPSRCTESLGIQLAHVSHSNDANAGIFLCEKHAESADRLRKKRKAIKSDCLNVERRSRRTEGKKFLK